jgi:acetyl-CoA acetyltransferase
VKSPVLKRVLAVVVMASIASGLITLAIAGGGEETGKLEHAVSLEGKTGLTLLLAKWYNENRLVYALVVTATMAVLGIVVGQITEFTLRLIGVR